MTYRTLHIAFLSSLFGVLFLTCLPLPAQNEIVANDSAKLLRRIWMMRGGVVGGDQVGRGAGSVGDIDRDSLQDFGWYLGATNQWHIHRGGSEISTTPNQILDSLGTIPSHPIVGDFYGNGKPYVGFSGFFRVDTSGPRRKLFMRYRLVPVEGDTLSLHSALTLAPELTWRPNLETTHRNAFAIDLDRDGDDELIIVAAVILFDQEADRHAEIWIFEGGPEFQLDTPTVVLKDTEENYIRFDVSIGNLDGDPYPDILAAGDYNPADPVNRLKFWWGHPNLSQLSLNPERTLTLNDSETYPNVSFAVPFMPLFDSDGDRVQEFMLPGADGDWYYYNMNAPGKDPRTRPLTLADAERSYRGYNKPYKVGYLNDSTRRYEMVGRTGGDPGGGARMVVLSGGKDGPNPTYDAYYSAAADGLTPGNVFGRGGPIGDATGDGYDDYLAANPEWFNLQQGIVVLLAGGPYIPNDDTTLSVQSVATDEHRAALHIWPNPVSDELHVAWRGDLKRPPGLLRIYDMNGRLIVEGPVNTGRGEAIWKCGSVASGSYLLVVCDRHGTVLAQTTLVKQ